MSAESEMEPVLPSQSDDPDGLRIQFLYFATCPHAPQALTLLQEVLLSEGLVPKIEMITVETEEAARQYNFYGSPTIRVNGEDVSPSDARSTPFLGCRLYPQPDGRFAPHPSAEAIAHALRQPHQTT
jgi:hypothetical protein